MAITRISTTTPLELSSSLDNIPLNNTQTSPIKSLAKERMDSLAKSVARAPKTTLYRANRILKTFEKALIEHGKTPEQARQIIEANRNEKYVPLTLSFQDMEAQGIRPSMEDAHFFKETDEYAVFGVCDGHADDGKIAKLCAKRIPNEFQKILQSEGGDVPKAAQKMIDVVHQQVQRDKMYGGSTVVFCYLEKASNNLTVATLGDSEARLYRKSSAGVECIPLSRVLDWTTKKEARRAADALGLPSLAEDWPKVKKELAKLLRAPPLIGPNLTRAVGDQEYQGYIYRKDIKLICQDVLVQQFKIRPGDKIVVGCDGLWDVEDKLLSKEIMAPNWDKPVNLAKKAVDFALNTQKSTDNVSVVVVNTTAKA